MRSGFTWSVFAGLLLSTALASPAWSQDVVVMRRVIAPPTRTTTPQDAPTPTPTPAPTASGYYSWQVSPWSQTGECGQMGTETRTVACETSDGITVADSFCVGHNSGPKPISQDAVVVTGTCSYGWRTGDWSGDLPTCGSATLVRDVVCLRSDGSVVADAQCAGAKPSTTEGVSGFDGCTFAWSAGAWGVPSTTCGSATESRPVSCRRSDGATSPDASCPGVRPEASQTVVETSGCTASWVTGPWGGPAPACGATTESRTVVCQRADGETVSDDQCAGAKPETSQPATDMSTCGFSWRTGDWSAPGATCGTSTQTRDVTCVDGSGAPADDSRCSGTKPQSVQEVVETSGCTYSWAAAAWGATAPGCGATTQTRQVSCVRSDGAAAADADCSQVGPEPDASRPATDYSACTDGWTAGAWSDWSTSCGQATQTRTVSCERSDGTAEPDTACTGVRPDASQTAYQISGCSFQWSTGAWGAPVPACGATTETRSVTCSRSDGTVVDDAQCAQSGDKPPTAQAANDYTTCSFSWSVADWSDWSTSCGAATRTRSVSCQRSDGASAQDGQCTDAKPDSSESSTQTSSCSYSWAPSAWGAATPACGASTHSRSVTCERSDGASVDPSLCSSAGTEPATSEAVADYSTCSYQWAADAWQGTPGACGASISQTRSVYCLRSNGDHVADSLCSAAGSKPASTQTVSDYSQCSYAWVDGSFASNAPACSSSAPATRSVSCQRQDKVTVDNSFCDPSSPNASASGTVADYSACSYSWTSGAWSRPNSTCSASATETRTVACTRMDGAGTTVADSYCSSAGSKPATSQTVDSESDCTGLLANGGFESGGGSLTGWSTGGSASLLTGGAGGTNAHTGTHSVQIGYGGNVQQTISTVVGGVYSVTYWEYSTTSNNAHIMVFVTGNGSVGTAASSSSRSWAQRIFDFTASSTSTTINFYGASSSNSGFFPALDDVVVSRIQ